MLLYAIFIWRNSVFVAGRYRKDGTRLSLVTIPSPDSSLLLIGAWESRLIKEKGILYKEYRDCEERSDVAMVTLFSF